MHTCIHIYHECTPFDVNNYQVYALYSDFIVNYLHSFIVALTTIPDPISNLSVFVKQLKRCTSSPSHWQQVEEQAPKPVGWTMCFLLMTLVPVQKLCVNIYVYICVYIPYTSSVIGRIYNGSVIQYWRSCTPSRSIGECAVPDLNAILCFLWFTNCVLLFDNNLILGCLWHHVFV